MRRLVFLLILAAVGVGCSETVGFLSLELDVPEIDPPIQCESDPRRATTVHLTLDCGGEVREEIHLVANGRGSMANVPFAPCTLSVAIKNFHERTLFVGSQEVELVEGESDPISVTLVADKCDTDGCADGDGDGVYSIDEAALGIDDADEDSDGDGLQDGVELALCCTDPNSDSDASCDAFLIQDLLPHAGVPGSAVVISATDSFTDPLVTIGDIPFEIPLVDAVDTKTYVGVVPPNAVLGDVSITKQSGEGIEVTATSTTPFAVLREPPTLFYNMDPSLAEKLKMTVAFDIASAGPNIFLLGGRSVGEATFLPGVLRVELENNHQRKATLLGIDTESFFGIPIVIDAREGLVAALVYEGTTETNRGANVFTSNAPSAPVITAERHALTGIDATSLAVEPDGRHVLISRRAGFIRLDSADSAGTLSPSATIPKADGIYCGGIAAEKLESGAGELSAGTYAFMSCTRCPPASELSLPLVDDRVLCAGGRATLFRFGPIEGCMSGASTASCWSEFPITRDNTDMLGSPVVDLGADAQSERPREPSVFFSVRLATNPAHNGRLDGGVYRLPVAASPGDHPRLIINVPPDFIALRRHPLRINYAAGQLYALGSHAIQRYDLMTERELGSVIVGGFTEPNINMALVGNDSALAVIRSVPGKLTDLATICLRRCDYGAAGWDNAEGCVCQVAPPTPP